MKGRTVFKWAIGVIAIVVFIGVGAVVLLFVAGFISLEKGEQHRRQFQAELDSGRWDFGEQPALFAVAEGIVKNDPEAIRAAAKNVSVAGACGSILLASTMAAKPHTALPSVRRVGRMTIFFMARPVPRLLALKDGEGLVTMCLEYREESRLRQGSD